MVKQAVDRVLFISVLLLNLLVFSFFLFNLQGETSSGSFFVHFGPNKQTWGGGEGGGGYLIIGPWGYIYIYLGR